MRSAGYYSLDELDYAIFESNGKLSTKEKANPEKQSSSLPVLIVCEGKIIHNNLSVVGLDIAKVTDILKKHGAKNVKDVGVMTVDGNGKIYFQIENKPYESFNIRLKEGIEW